MEIGFAGKSFLIKLRRVLTTLVCSFLLFEGGGGGTPDDVSTSNSFRGCGCVFPTFANSLTKDSHNTGNFMPYTFRIVCGFSNVPLGTYKHGR